MPKLRSSNTTRLHQSKSALTLSWQPTLLIWSPHGVDKSGAGRSFDDKSRERRCGYF